MKNLLIAIVALAAVSTQARYINDVDASWSLKELQRPGLMIQSTTNPKVQGIPNAGVSGAGRTVYMSITNLCVENGRVQSKNAVEVCTDYDFIRDNDGDLTDRKECVASEMAVLSAPIEGSRQVCDTSASARFAWRRANGDRDFDTDFPNCSVFKTIDVKKKTTWSFNIVKKVGKGSTNYSNRYKGQFLFKKTFTLPACY